MSKYSVYTSSVGVLGMPERKDVVPSSRSFRAYKRRLKKWPNKRTERPPIVEVEHRDGYWLASVKRRQGGSPPGLALARFLTERQAYSWALYEVVLWQRYGLSATGYYHPVGLMDYPLTKKDRILMARVWLNHKLSIFRVWETC